VVAAFQKLRRTISQKFGFPVTLWYTLVTMSQFHFIFYMSRPLPNIFAMPFGETHWDMRSRKLFVIADFFCLFSYNGHQQLAASGESQIYLVLCSRNHIVSRRTSAAAWPVPDIRPLLQTNSDDRVSTNI
jgi:hypothetical protein